MDIYANTIVVGATGESSSATGVNGDESDNSSPSAGAAYVFVRNGTTWTQQAYLKASDTGINDMFGAPVAIHGDTIVVGAQREDSAAQGVNGDDSDDFLLDSGAAYVFVRSGAVWTQEAYLKASNPGAVDFFGATVAISGSTVVVGAILEDSAATGVDGDELDDSLGGSGAAYVFVRSGKSWSQQAYLKASNTNAGDQFGRDVEVDGDTILVSASTEDGSARGVNGGDSNSLTNSGAAYVFRRADGTWIQDSYVKASNTGRNDGFGLAVSLWEETYLIGAFHEESDADGVGGDQSDNSAAEAGAASVYERPRPLEADTALTSLQAGGQHVLTLDAKPARAGWFYWIFGSASGTEPGLDLGGGVTLPLVFDGYFQLTLKPSLGAFGDFLGQLDASGKATATLAVPPGVDPSLAGITLHHAYLAAEVLGNANFASNAVPLLLVP